MSEEDSQQVCKHESSGKAKEVSTHGSAQWLEVLLSAEGIETTNTAQIGDYIVVGVAGNLAESPEFFKSH